MQVRVLGPVELLGARGPVRLARRQHRVILGVLALAPNTLITYDRLIDLLWGYQVPRRARVILQTRVSELRAAMLADGPHLELSTRPTGYVLTVAPDQVDAHRFLQLLAEARSAGDPRARDLLREALALWRGPVFGGDLSTDTQAALGHDLESTRLTAAEELYEVELRSGSLARLADEVRAAAAANPHRERLIRLSMIALDRAGRSADALADYDQWRRWLADSFGADPSPQAQRLHVEILRRSDGEPEFTPSAPKLLPPNIADFTGRVAEITTLLEILTGTGPDRRSVIVVSGPAGVGKTALSVHAAHLMSARFADGLLYANLRGADDRDQVDACAVLGRFLRALGVDGGAIPSTLDERIDLYRGLLGDRRALVVLDNAAADAQVLPLIPGGSACATIITSRTRLGGVVGAHSLHMDVLDPDEAVLLLRGVAGADRVSGAVEEVTALCRLCGYLPLALRVAAAKLSAKPHWTVGKLVEMLADERLRLNQLSHGHLDVRASIALSYRELAEDDRRLLRRLGDLDLSDIPVWVCAALLDTDVATAETVLERLYDAQLVQYAGSEATGQPRYRMHDLVRLFALERCHHDEPADLVAAARERAFGAWLGMVGVARRSLNLVDYDYDYNNTEVRRPVAPTLSASVIGDAQEWFERERPGIIRMIEHAAGTGHGAVATALADATSMVFAMHRHFDDWHHAVELSLAVACQGGDIRGEAILRGRLGSIYSVYLRDADAHEQFGRSAALFRDLGDVHGEAIGLAWCAVLPRSQNRHQEAIDLLHRAQSVFRDRDDRGGVAFTAQRLGRNYLEMGEFDAADVHLDEGLRIYRVMGSRQGQAQTLFWRGTLRMRQGRHREAEHDLAEALSLSRSLGDPSGIAACLRGLGANHNEQGDQKRAREILTEALRLVRQPTPTRIEDLIRQDLAAL